MPGSERVMAILAETIALHERVKQGELGPVTTAAAAIIDAFRQDGRLLTFGNGGSAADAQHVAADLVGRFLRERPSLAAIALTTDTSVLTSVANDYAFDRVFARQIEALGESGDVAIGITTSGGSKNVLKAFTVAKERGLTTVAVTGCDGGEAGRIADVHLNVPDESTARVQEVHRTLLHVICELVEETL